MATKMLVYSDYVWPFCYVGQGLVERLKTTYDVDVEWRAFELHPETPPEGRRYPPHLRARFAGTFTRLHEQAGASGREMVAPEVIPNTRRALEAAEYARDHGAHERFHAAVFRKIYGEGQDIGRWDVLRAAAVEAALDAEEMQ